MGACLGVYIGEKIIKYAKLEQDSKTNKISLSSYGTKYVSGNSDAEIADIIAQTGSANSALSVSLKGSYLIETEILKQLKSYDVESVVELEVSDSAVQKGLNDKLLEHRYALVDSSVSPSNVHALIEVANRTDVDKYINNENFKKLEGLYPIEYVLNKITTKQEDYVLVNVDEETSLIFVSNNMPVAIKKLDINMKSILDELAVQEGSYARACDLCRTINVLSDERLDSKLEAIIEPVVQDLLNRVKNEIEESNFKPNRIVINGLINLFINIEMLFEQFLGIDAEKLKPSFLNLDEATVNISEVIESNEAIALANEGLKNNIKSMNFAKGFVVDNKPKLDFNLKELFSKKDGKNVTVLPNIDVKKVEKVLLFANLTAASLLVGYGTFSAIYNNSMNNLAASIEENIATIKDETGKVNNDISHINKNRDKYNEYNDYITTTVQKIREGKIGKYTTYNVANFMQKIAKYIPTNVQLESIASNDNKTVTIVAKSKSYAELGYFVAQLKLKGILENVSTGTVEHGKYITVTIGGDLP